MLPIVILAVFGILMALVAFNDLTSMTIPNWLNLAVLASFFVFAPVLGLSWPEFGTHILVGLSCFVVGLLLFTFGVFGGGDAKLLAATGFWWAWTDLVTYLFFMAAIGGGLSLVLLLLRKLPMPALIYKSDWSYTLLKEETQVPYGVAMGIAGVIALLSSQIWASVGGF